MSENDNHDTLIETVLVLAGGFLAVKTFANFFAGDQASKDKINKQLNTPAATNIFSPLNTALNTAVQKSGSTYHGTPMTLPQYVQNFKDDYDKKMVSPGDVEYTVADAAEKIWSAYSAFTLFTNADQVQEAFATLTDQLETALVSAYFQYNYNTDLLTLLKNGRWYDIYGIDAKILAQVIDAQNALQSGKISLPDITVTAPN